MIRYLTLTECLVLVAKLVPVGYGIKKLQIGCVVEDDKVSVALMTILVLFDTGLTWTCLCAGRWAPTSWRRRSRCSRITFSRWMLRPSTRSENDASYLNNKSTKTKHVWFYCESPVCPSDGGWGVLHSLQVQWDVLHRRSRHSFW